MRKLMLVLTVTLLWSVTPAGLAQDGKKAKPPADKKVTTAKAEAPTPAELRVQMHRTMAALIEAESAKKPDLAKIDKLTKRLVDLRVKMWVQRPVGPGARPCPRGGPGMGYGRGCGQCPGMGCGLGPAGYGPGRGAGYGPGRGAGYGPGRGAGYGPGMGRGLGFVDRDSDGTCDNRQKAVTPTAK